MILNNKNQLSIGKYFRGKHKKSACLTYYYIVILCIPRETNKCFFGFKPAIALACTLWSTWLLKARRCCRCLQYCFHLLHANVDCFIYHVCFIVHNTETSYQWTVLEFRVILKINYVHSQKHSFFNFSRIKERMFML